MPRILLLAATLGVLVLPRAAQAGAITEEVVAFPTHDGLVLEGILSYPRRGAGPHPAMLLIHGSGLHDADVTLDIPDFDFTDGEQTLFRDVARFFSRRGLAVLRYNKRGASFHHENDQPELLLDSTLEDLIRDAESAYRALAGHPRADPERIAVYGHSEGSIVAPRVVRRVDSAKLLVMVGSTASGLEQALYFQGVEIYRLFFEVAADGDGDGVVTLQELDRLDGNFGFGSFWVGNIARLLFLLETRADGTVTAAGFHPDVDVDADGELHVANELLPRLETAFRESLEAWRSGAAAGRYGQSLLRMKPNRDLIWKVRTTILFCQGELDFQTPLSETLDLIAVLESRGRASYEALLFPDLGHSLSQPNDFFLEDGGLTILDNPTLNAMARPTMRKILKRVKSLLAE